LYYSFIVYYTTQNNKIRDINGVIPCVIKLTEPNWQEYIANDDLQTSVPWP